MLTKIPQGTNIYMYIIFKTGSNSLSKIELKTEIKANFDESFAHFKLTLGSTTNRCGVLKNSNVEATEHSLNSAKI